MHRPLLQASCALAVLLTSVVAGAQVAPDASAASAASAPSPAAPPAPAPAPAPAAAPAPTPAGPSGAPDAPRAWSLDLTIDNVGIGIGNSRRVDGLRLNVTDAAPFVVNGVNLTLWTPEEHGGGRVNGLALGVPLTGVRDLAGVGVGIGLGAEDSMTGLAVGVIGLGAGKDVTGLTLAGLGAGAGHDLSGVTLAGIGGGAGGSVYGLSVGGLGFGAGGDVVGLTVAGLGAGAGGSMRGINIAGLGLGAGHDLDGISLALGALGAGQHVRGLMIAGLGMGSGGSLAGVGIAGLGLGAAELDGVDVALAVGAKDARGVFIAPAWFEIVPGGSVEGVSVSAVNRIRGEQRGLAIGVVNYAHSLHGVQIGLLNWADNSSLLKLMPLVNVHVD